MTKSELADMMNSFISDDDEKWLMFNAKFSSADERVFLCGASSKDAGARITSIVEDYGIAKYNSVIAEDEVEEAIADLKSRVYELKKIRLIRKREFN